MKEAEEMVVRETAGTKIIQSCLLLPEASMWEIKDTYIETSIFLTTNKWKISVRKDWNKIIWKQDHTDGMIAGDLNLLTFRV